MSEGDGNGTSMPSTDSNQVQTACPRDHDTMAAASSIQNRRSDPVCRRPR